MTGEFPDDPRGDGRADRALGMAPAHAHDLDDPEYLALALAAAAADLAIGRWSVAEMPAALHAAIAKEAPAHLRRDPSPRRRPLPTLGWLGGVAAAASLLVAAWSWRSALRESPPTVAERLARLRATARPIALSATDHPLARGAVGEMIWGRSGNEGYLVLRGLARVDPAKGAYQLWIFDVDRDARYPVDGGVFTVDDPSRPTVVPIRPTLRVARPTLYAVTLEPPGGVVVSDRKRIMLTGTPPP